MKLLVPVKRVIDYNVKVRVKADGSGVDLANVKMSMNPFDEIAVEEAIRLKEKGIATEVVVVSIGVKQAQETLRTALAMGADRAILIEAAADVHTDIEPLAVAKLLAGVVKEEGPGLVLCGKQAIDNDMNATGQMLSALLGWSQATFASEVAIEGDTAKVTREVDGGLQTIAVKLPTIISVPCLSIGCTTQPSSLAPGRCSASPVAMACQAARSVASSRMSSCTAPASLLCTRSRLTPLSTTGQPI